MQAKLSVMPSQSSAPSLTSCCGFLDRKRAQHHGIKKAEDGGIGANAEGQRDKRDNRDGRSAQHGAQSITGILQKCLQPVPTPCHMALLLDAGDIAESLLCRPAGCFRSEAGGDLLLAAQFEVKTHLFIEFALKVGRGGAACRVVVSIRPRNSWVSPQAVWMIREMAPITRWNCDTSMPSCFSPARVRV